MSQRLALEISYSKFLILTDDQAEILLPVLMNPKIYSKEGYSADAKFKTAKGETLNIQLVDETMIEHTLADMVETAQRTE